MTQEQPEIRYEMLRPGQIIETRDETPIIYLALGPLEWHGPHMPYGTDMLRPHLIAMAAARETGGLVFPPIPFGTETCLTPDALRYRGFSGDEKIIGMDFPAFPLPSLYSEESALGVLTNDLIGALKRQQWKVIVIVNGHGGPNHRTMLARIAAEQTDQGKVAVVFANSFVISPTEGGHANRGEISSLMAYYPDTVDLGTLPPLPTPLKNLEYGVLDAPTCRGNPTPDFSVRLEFDPRNAQPEEGRQDVATQGARIAKLAREALATVS